MSLSLCLQLSLFLCLQFSLSLCLQEDRQWALRRGLEEINREIERANRMGVACWFPMGSPSSSANEGTNLLFQQVLVRMRCALRLSVSGLLCWLGWHSFKPRWLM